MNCSVVSILLNTLVWPRNEGNMYIGQLLLAIESQESTVVLKGVTKFLKRKRPDLAPNNRSHIFSGEIRESFCFVFYESTSDHPREEQFFGARFWQFVSSRTPLHLSALL